MVVYIIFWFCVFLLVYSYILYPLFVFLLYRFTKKSEQSISDSNFRRVFILMAAHNEEDVIAAKLKSINNSDYPIDKLHIFIGSDNSTDQTNHIISEFKSESKFPISFHVMEKRSGKIGTINTLYQRIKKDFPLNDEDVFILTDADIILTPATVKTLSRHFANPEIGVVDTQIINQLDTDKNVASSESKYLNNENNLKYREGEVFGMLMGTFGGCFALRSSCFKMIPNHFKVDDFYLTMNALSQGYKAISDPEAVCHGKVVSTFSEEFKRKRRMSSGNFQNMAAYKKYLLPFSKLGFVFFSHKVIRYNGPFLMLIILSLNIYLVIKGVEWMEVLLLGQILWYIGIPIIDRLSTFLGINVLALRNVSYFNYMNLALLLGFKDYIHGIESNIWEPTKRK